jgi:hypothetical protein
LYGGRLHRAVFLPPSIQILDPLRLVFWEIAIIIS